MDQWVYMILITINNTWYWRESESGDVNQTWHWHIDVDNTPSVSNWCLLTIFLCVKLFVPFIITTQHILLLFSFNISLFIAFQSPNYSTNYNNYNVLVNEAHCTIKNNTTNHGVNSKGTPNLRKCWYPTHTCLETRHTFNLKCECYLTRWKALIAGDIL